MRALFKNRNFLLIWLSQAVSSLGNWINFVGLNLYVYDIFGSGKILALFLTLRMLPSILFGSLGGYLADRYPRKTIMIICDSLRIFLVLGFLFTRNLTAFYVLGFVLSAVDKIFMASNSAFLPDIVEKEKLLEANSLVRMTYSVIMVLGPALGGLLITLFSYKMVFVADSLTFLLSVICISLIFGYVEEEHKSLPQAVWDEFKVAFSFVVGKFSMFFITILRVIDALGSGAYNTSLPIFSKSFLLNKGVAYGWLMGIWAAGEFTGGVVTKHISRRWNIPPEKIYNISVIIMALGMGLTFHCKNLYFALFAIYFGGVGDGISNIIFYTTLMKETPGEIRGKVMGSLTSLVYTVVGAGMMCAGFLVDKYSLHFVTDISSAVIILSACVGLFISFEKFCGDETEPSVTQLKESKEV